ncbi:MAG: hypothetical protein KAT33_02790 [Bacteroidales bacterium]|jgi:hypothetical protein|nr:hypothetical protein [Bacteroidales bacterium]MCK4638325.1 hypothetical protein [Bacteroidales bacterium]
MKKITNRKSISENWDYLGALVDDVLSELKDDSYKNRKKILEVCHVGKLLMFFENNLKIEKLREEPDFIITDKQSRIGLEHQIVVDQQSKEKEGFVGNLFLLAEKELKKDKDLPNFLANIYIHPYFSGKVNDKKWLVNEICRIVKHYILKKELIENEIIEGISSMKHSQINLSANLGGWWQKEISEEIIQKAVIKKEKKIEAYISNTNLPQWLLLVIDSIGESSYRFENNFEPKIETKFEKVFLLEDFCNNLYELK